MATKPMTQEIAEKIAARKHANYGAVTFYWGSYENADGQVVSGPIVQGVDCYDRMVQIPVRGYHC